MARTVSALALLCGASATLPVSTNWTQVPIGGGGYVLGIYFHPTTPDVYIKTDVGGAYRRTSYNGTFAWTPLLDFVGPADSLSYSVSSMALDPLTGQTVYILMGGDWRWSTCIILVSTDGGTSWTWTEGSKGWALTCGGNDGDRMFGERMAVNPQDGALIAVGGTDGRVHVSRDAFGTSPPPAPVVLPPPQLPGVCNPSVSDLCVVRTVLWVDTAGGQVLLAAVPAVGLFVAPTASADKNGSFIFVSGSGGNSSTSAAPALIARVVAVEEEPGRVWVTCQSTGVWSGVLTPGEGGASWSVAWDVHALGGEGVAFSGIAIRPRSNGTDIVVVSSETNSNTTVWRTTSGGPGAVFNPQAWTSSTTVPWWGVYQLAMNAAADAAFDPAAPDGSPELWVTDFFGVWRAAGAAASSPLLHFTNVERGAEEVCMNFVLAPPVGPTISGAADDFGWVHDQGISAYPTTTFQAPDGGHNCAFSADFTLTLSPNKTSADTLYVTAGDEYGICRNGWCGLHSWIGVSHDGGVTFTDTTWDAHYQVDQANPYRVVVHPYDGRKAVVVARSGVPVSYTRDSGQTWANATGGGATLDSCGVQGNFWFGQPLVAEQQVDPTSPEATIYFYNGTTTLWTSTDSGATFTAVYDRFPTWNVPFFGVAVPPLHASAAGDIWVFSGWKLYHSVNGGLNFTSVWSMYSLDHVLAVGGVPITVSTETGRDAGQLARLCADKHAAAAAAAGLPALPVPGPTATGGAAAYAVYAFGLHNYGESEALHVSVDFGGSWHQLSGGNTTATGAGQALGDSPVVIEASASQPGVLFVGTGGRGLFVRDVSAELQALLLACED